MTKPLSSMTPRGREEAIERRLKSNTKGIGYWAAIDALARMKKGAVK